MGGKREFSHFPPPNMFLNYYLTYHCNGENREKDFLIKKKKVLINYCFGHKGKSLSTFLWWGAMK